MSLEQTQAIIVCEGYTDRSFFDGWLLNAGCLKSDVDPWGKTVRGQYGYVAPDGRFLKVAWSGDRVTPRKLSLDLLSLRATNPTRHLVLQLDQDHQEQTRRESFRDTVRQVDPLATQDGQDAILSDGTRVSLILWQSYQPATPELPAHNCLERLVCAAIRAAYPTRAPYVRQWLENRPEDSSPPELKDSLEAKAHAQSYIAAWYPDVGGDAFYKVLWTDPLLRPHLEHELKAIGAWQTIEKLLNE